MGSEDSETHSLHFDDFWAGYGVDTEVLRGAKLREEKQKNCKNEKPFIPIAFNIKSSANLCNNDKRRRKREYKENQSSKKYRCPMRIAELAIPTKRHCLDTWRQRGNTLPSFMVDRLRQHVMDQKAVVQINDAIQCFKSCKQSRHPKRNKSRMTKKKVDKATPFCCLFGHKIMLKLFPPGRLPIIGTSLINLSRIINEDIGKLVRRGKTIKHHKTQNEISDKLAVWIATILQDTDVKLMIDDLKDLEEREGHIWDIMDDLINGVSESCKSKSISNKGEEYASRTSSFMTIESNKSINSYKLDKISHSNELIDILVPEAEASKIENMDFLAHIIDSVCRYDPRVETFIQNHIDDIISKALSETNEIISIDEITNIPTHEDLVLATEIKPTLSCGSVDATLKDISNMIQLEDTIQLEKTDIEQNKDFIGTENTQPEVGLVGKQSNDEVDSHIEESHEIIDASNQLKESTTPQYKSDLGTNNNVENIQNEIEETNLQETDVGVSPNDKNVKFSNIHIGKQLPIADYHSRYDEDDATIFHRKLASSSSRNYFQHNINFSPLNTDILCNVNETWPDHLHPLTTKPSVSVSKSIISLGLIMEADEKPLSTNSDKLKAKQDDESCVTIHSKINNDDTVKEASLLDLSNLNESIQSKVEKTHQTLKESESDYILNILSSYVINKRKLIVKDAYTSSLKLNLMAENLSGINLNSEIVSSKKPTNDKQIQTDDAMQIKLNYKPISQQKLRIWCMGLDNVIINVDKWLKWLKYTHTVVSHLKNNDIRTSKERELYIKEWQKFKKSIDSDSQLWFHLHQSLSIGMNRYRNYYNSREMIKSLQVKACVCNTNF